MSHFAAFSAVQIFGPEPRRLYYVFHNSLDETDRDWVFHSEGFIRLFNAKNPSIIFHPVAFIGEDSVLSAVAEFCAGLQEDANGMKKSDPLLKLLNKTKIIIPVGGVELKVGISETLASLRAKLQAEKQEKLSLDKPYAEMKLACQEIFSSTALRFHDEERWKLLAAERPPEDVAYAIGFAKFFQHRMDTVRVTKTGKNGLNTLDTNAMMTLHYALADTYYDVAQQPGKPGEYRLAPPDTLEWTVGALSGTWVYGNELAERYKDMISRDNYPYKHLVPPARDRLPHEKGSKPGGTEP